MGRNNLSLCRRKKSSYKRKSTGEVYNQQKKLKLWLPQSTPTTDNTSTGYAEMVPPNQYVHDETQCMSPKQQMQCMCSEAQRVLYRNNLGNFLPKLFTVIVNRSLPYAPVRWLGQLSMFVWRQNVQVSEGDSCVRACVVVCDMRVLMGVSWSR